MLHVLITSRERKETEYGLGHGVKQSIRITSSCIDADIRAYISARLQTEQKLKILAKNERDQHILVEKLMDKAVGM